MSFKPRHLLAAAGPFDPTDEGNIACDRYRRKFLQNSERALKRGPEHFTYMITGSMVAMVEMMVAAGQKESEIEKITADVWAFSIAQATRGRVIPDGAMKLATEHAAARGEA